MGTSMSFRRMTKQQSAGILWLIFIKVKSSQIAFALDRAFQKLNQQQRRKLNEKAAAKNSE